MLSKLTPLLKKSSNLYLLDLSWHLHRSYHAFNMSVSINGYERPTGHIYGVLSTVRMIENTDPNAVIIITQDGHPTVREEISVSDGFEYKEGRPELEFDFYQDIPLLKASLCLLPNVFWAYNEDKECDDEMYALAKKAEALFDGKIYIYSGDNDLLQAIDDRISVIRNKTSTGFEEITDEVVRTDEKFTKKFHGVDTKHIVNFRAIVGDPSDKIPGIRRFPRDIAVFIAMSSDNITEEINYTPVSNAEKKYYNLLLEEMETVKRNYHLMKLDADYVVNITKPKPNVEKLVSKLEQLQVKSYLSYLRNLNLI